MSEQKNLLRKQLKAWRLSLTEKQVEQSGELLKRVFWEKIKQKNQSAKKLRIGFYYSMNGEVDTKNLLKDCLKKDIACFFPIIDRDKSQKILSYAQVFEDTLFKPGAFGILEPQTQVYYPASKLTHLLIPALAVTKTGERLGLGAGYYDATLTALRQKAPAPLCWGVVYEPQCLDFLPQENWDQVLDDLILISLNENVSPLPR